MAASDIEHQPGCLCLVAQPAVAVPGPLIKIQSPQDRRSVKAGAPELLQGIAKLGLGGGALQRVHGRAVCLQQGVKGTDSLLQQQRVALHRAQRLQAISQGFLGSGPFSGRAMGTQHAQGIAQGEGRFAQHCAAVLEQPLFKQCPPQIALGDGPEHWIVLAAAQSQDGAQDTDRPLVLLTVCGQFAEAQKRAGMAMPGMGPVGEATGVPAAGGKADAAAR